MKKYLTENNEMRVNNYLKDMNINELCKVAGLVNVKIRVGSSIETIEEQPLSFKKEIRTRIFTLALDHIYEQLDLLSDSEEILKIDKDNNNMIIYNGDNVKIINLMNHESDVKMINVIYG